MTERTCITCQHNRLDLSGNGFCAHPDLLRSTDIKHGASFSEMDRTGLCDETGRKRWAERKSNQRRLTTAFEGTPIPATLVKSLMTAERKKNALDGKTKRPRGRPKTKVPKQVRPNWKWFNCIYANSVAQVYQRALLPNTQSGQAEIAPNDPTADFYPGECLVTFIRRRGDEQVLDLWPFPDVEPMTSDAAIRLARSLFEEAGEDDRYGDDPDTHERGQYRLYANPVYDVRYWSDGDSRCDRPFIVFHRSLGKILLTGRGTVHRFTTLDAAISKADELIKGQRP